MTADQFTCQRCGQTLPRSRMKEILYEEGHGRYVEELCPSCLDRAMNEAGRVRGVVGRSKAAAAHLDDVSEAGDRRSLGDRG